MSIEKTLNNLENKLSLYSLCPFVVPGVAKFGIGVVQTVSSLAVGLICAVPAYFQHEKSQYLVTRSIKHIKHGLGNVVAGGIEAIPIVGTGFIAIRFYRVNADKNAPDTLCTTLLWMQHPKFKFYPYEHNTIETFLKKEKKNRDNYMK